MSSNNDQFVLSKLVDLLYRNIRLGQIVSIFNASLMLWISAALLPSSQLSAITGWWFFASIVAASRIWLARKYNLTDSKQRELDAVRWRKHAFAGAAASGIIWASGALLMMIGTRIELQLYTAFAMAGTVAAAVPVLAADRLAFRVYGWPIILAVAIGSLGTDPLHIAFSVMSILFLLMTTRSADYFHDTLLDTFRLEHEKDSLVNDLQHAKSIAETSNRAKTEFLANVSHELRTPMNGIMGMADLLDMEELTEDQRSYLLPLRSSADDLMHLINQMIRLSALESGQIKLTQQPFAVTDFLEDMLGKENSQAKAKGLVFALEQDPAVPEVLVGDLELLRQTLANLVGNAIKFTDQGQVSISVKVAEHSAEQIKLAFVISDTGPGIAPEKIQQLLSGLFIQADGSIIRRHGGTGIGLPIARKLIELLGGQLEIASQVGVGSTFSFTLPFKLHKD